MRGREDRLPSLLSAAAEAGAEGGVLEPLGSLEDRGDAGCEHDQPLPELDAAFGPDAVVRKAGVDGLDDALPAVRRPGFVVQFEVVHDALAAQVGAAAVDDESGDFIVVSQLDDVAAHRVGQQRSEAGARERGQWKCSARRCKRVC